MDENLKMLFCDYQTRRVKEEPKVLMDAEKNLFCLLKEEKKDSKKYDEIENVVAALTTTTYEFEGFKAGFKLAMGIMKEL